MVGPYDKHNYIYYVDVVKLFYNFLILTDQTASNTLNLSLGYHLFEL